MNLLKHVDSDIICINETNLKTTQVIELEGYQYNGHNRTSINVNAPKGSGGVGIFVRHILFDTFDVSVIDKSHDGILGIALSKKITSYKIAVFTTYLPPENSPWGRNARDFYSHLLGQMYLSSDIKVILAGDLNSRIGNMSDTISDMDNIPKRNCLDTAVNSHGHIFLEFLNDSKMCVINGRFKEGKIISHLYHQKENPLLIIFAFLTTIFPSVKAFKSFHRHRWSPNTTCMTVSENALDCPTITF